ncbi:putative mediator of RNA polymerase II transcription subunit 26 [Scaptodrosophila lebanonensis]|uniref:Mediator of RNA polymerase II transcription subunit 26 n=1 Tax=Drosophila lebanonensis TaxID=7225 RepID=A0A6J2TBF9_DROLE|nr:putative mediator of RNA polymerase II transcription subunit 26 [Scaptodrosophila lebanonensis]
MVIQRSWKILSDAGGTTSSSATIDGQQRSPTALQATSSSDDSDCSNQTTHSMDTRVASPMAAAEGARKGAETDTAESLKLSTLSETAEPAVKYVTTSEMAETMLQRIRQRLSSGQHMESGGSAESAMRSLELLRISVQRSFDLEVNEIIKRYMDDYFKPAFANIKENLGQHAINEEMLQKMSCALLENAKTQYTHFARQQRQPIVGISEQQRLALKRPANSKLNGNDYGQANKLCNNNLGYIVKSLPCNPTIQNELPVLMQQQQQQLQQQQLQPQQQQQQLQQRQHVTPLVGGTLPTPVRRQIFWNTSQISTTTKFVLDVQANLAFGFGTDGKERLASKHPELIRYLPDAEDRNWMATQGIIPAENRSSRFLFLIYDEVCRLQQTHELYRHKSNIDLSMMLTFNVTEPMIQKMKMFFVDLNIKSRGLITNSFIVANNQQQQQQQQQAGNNSHLRNALLQGVTQTQPAQQQQLQQQQQQLQLQLQQPQQTVQIEEVALKELPVSAAAPCLQGTVVGSTTTPLKTKLVASSTLSSSHATLTALLNNPHSGSGGSSSTNAGSNSNTSKFRT